MKRKMAVVCCFGGGGHEEQMNRLMQGVDFRANDVISISDSDNDFAWSSESFFCRSVREKNEKNILKYFCSFIFNVRVFLRILYKYKVVCVVSTGPGISALYAIFFKLFGSDVVHIETWSRFYSKSFTGQVMYWVADFFYVQNVECMKLYPRAIYAGRL